MQTNAEKKLSPADGEHTIHIRHKQTRTASQIFTFAFSSTYIYIYKEWKKKKQQRALHYLLVKQ